MIGIKADDLYYRKSFYNGHYKVFRRLNDRKTMQSDSDLIMAGYPLSIRTESEGFKECTKWCDEQYGPYGYVNFGISLWFFENENDRLMFKMRWE